jgi:hypothetical protein
VRSAAAAVARGTEGFRAVLLPRSSDLTVFSAAVVAAVLCHSMLCCLWCLCSWCISGWLLMVQGC